MSKRDFDHNFKKNVRLDMDQDPPNAARFEEIRANIHKRIAEEGLNGRAEEPPKKNKFPVGKTVGIIAACVVGFFVLVLALPDMPMAQALRSNTQKTLNQLFRPDETDEQGNIIRHFSDYDIMDEEIGFHLPRPGWIPDEYRLEDIQVKLLFNSDLQSAKYTYVSTNDSEKRLTFNIINFLNIDASSMYSSTDGYDSVETEQGDVIVSKQAPYSARFFYHDQYLVNIIDVSDKEILLKIVENIQ